MLGVRLVSACVCVRVTVVRDTVVRDNHTAGAICAAVYAPLEFVLSLSDSP